MSASGEWPPIRLVVAEADGTLLTGQKELTTRAIGALTHLRAAGIEFSLVSCRPIAGVAPLTRKLGLTLPFGACNGAMIARIPGSVLRLRMLPETVAVHAIRWLSACGFSVWLHSPQAWVVADPNGPFVDRESRSLGMRPCAVRDFSPWLDEALKIVGVSARPASLDRLAATLQIALGPAAAVTYSNAHSLEVTSAAANQGAVVDFLRDQRGLAPEQVAVVGTSPNALAMFLRGGLRIAMGNAHEVLKAQADCVVRANGEDGFAHAIESWILPRRSVPRLSHATA